MVETGSPSMEVGTVAWFVFRELLSDGLRRLIPSPRLDQMGVGHPLPLLLLLRGLLSRCAAPSGLVPSCGAVAMAQ
jgi:hypothetical protein